MTLIGKFSLGVIAATGIAMSACSGAPTAPSVASPSLASSTDASVSMSGAGSYATAAAATADLQVSGSASTGSPNTGATFSYTFQVKNSGALTATGATLSDTLPAGTTFLTATAGGASGACALAAGVVTCNLGDLPAAGQSAVVITLAAPSTTGAFADTATTSSAAPDANMANNSVTITVQVKTPAVDTIKVSKCYTNAGVIGGGEMLIKAASSDATARLFAYRPDGTLIGEVQNGGGSRYGGTVMPYQPYDPVTVTIKSSAGGSVTVPTTPFQI